MVRVAILFYPIDAKATDAINRTIEDLNPKAVFVLCKELQ